MSTYTIELPWERPPLTANRRLHWGEQAKLTKRIRTELAWRVKAAINSGKLTPAQRVRVQLRYIPKTNRNRDTDNLWPTLKPICDGIVDAGLVHDDTPEYMDKPQPIIEPTQKRYRNRVRVDITVLNQGQEC